jgi:ferredoxin-NADP reductase
MNNLLALITEPTLFYAGAVCMAFAVLQVGWIVAGAWQRRRLRWRTFELQKQAFAQQLAATLRAARAASTKLAAWQGTRPLVVTAVVDEAVDVRSFYLADPEGRPLPSFEPGQYLTLHLPIGSEGKSVVRCYSLSDMPREQYYRLTIKRCGPPVDAPHLPAGRASSWMHDRAVVGTRIESSAPAGAFFLDPRYDEPVVLIAGGVGITPIYSMLAAIAANQPTRPVWLFYGVRNASEQIFAAALRDLVRDASTIRQFIAYSSPGADDRQGHDFAHRGRLTADLIQQQLPAGKYRYYLCGPAGMMQSLVVGLLDRGVADDHIHFEAFGPASVKRPSKLDVEPVRVRFKNAGGECQWTGEYDSLLDLAEANGIAVDFGCRAGNCGQCAVQVVEGRIATARKPGVAVADGQCLLCISTPASAVVLEV